MSYGYCYQGAGNTCSGRAQPGTVVLRDTIIRLIPEVGTMGIYNCRNSRTGSNLSLHGVGRAWDAATATLVLNRKLADFFVAAALDLGIQRVIAYGTRFDGTLGPREWDARQGERLWEYYSGPSHKDHNHVELCPHSAQNLTVKQVEAAVAKYWKGQEAGVSKQDVIEALNQLKPEDLDADSAFYKIWAALYEKRGQLFIEATDEARDVLKADIAQAKKEILDAINAP